VAGRIRQVETFRHLIGSQTCDLPASSIVPHDTPLVISIHNCSGLFTDVQFYFQNVRKENVPVCSSVMQNA
jgi:hypothetical protein